MLHISSSGTGQNSEKVSSTLTRSSVRAVEGSSSSQTHRPEIPSAKRYFQPYNKNRRVQLALQPSR